MDTNGDIICGYTEEVTAFRFAYISIGGSIALIGFINNFILAYLFIFRQIRNTPPQLYPAILALLDALLCLSFLMIFVVDVTMIYNKIEWLFVLFHHYIIFTFFCAKVIQFLIPYMLILATFERYTWIDNTKKRLNITNSSNYRTKIVIILIMVAITIRIPCALALTVTEFSECPDFFRTLAVDMKQWAQTSTLYMIYDVYGIAYLQTFCPFISLMILNVVIVKKLAKINTISRNNELVKTEITRKRSNVIAALRIQKLAAPVKNAIYSMVVIVSTYLISNTLHIILTLLEVTKSSILIDENDPYKASTIYTIFGDVVSILYMTSSAVRILIYAYCNPDIRQQVGDFLKMRKCKNLDDHLLN